MILHIGDTQLDLVVDDSSYRERGVGRKNELTLNFSLDHHIEVPVGAWCEFQGQRYELYNPNNFKETGYREYEYTLILEGEQAKLRKYRVRNTVDKRLKFDMTAKPVEFAQLMVDNLNMRDSGWTVGTCIDAVAKCLNFNHNNIEDVAGQVEQAFEVEVYLVGKSINIGKQEVNKDEPLPLAVGSGLKEGVKRDNAEETNNIEVVFVQGGDRNIDFSKYGSKELLLPKNQTIAYNGRTYTTDAEGYSVRRSDIPQKSFVEDSLDLSNIYPMREGTVSEVVVVNAEKNFYDFKDSSIPAALDFSTCRIAGERATVMFLTGMLAQRTFDIEQTEKELTGYVHAERRFKLVPAELDGVSMPNATFKPAVGDKYAVFGISMPDAYVCDNASQTGASWDMLKEAVKYLYENESSKFNITAELDGIWAKKDWVNRGGKIVVGGYVQISDSKFNPNGDVTRIVSIKDYVNNPHSPSIEITNSAKGGSFVSSIKKLQGQEVAMEASKKELVQYTKRRFRDTQETAKMLEQALLNFSGAINPITVQSMQMLVGDESLQYRFVSSKTAPSTVTPSIYYTASSKIFHADGGIIQHMTIGITSVKPSRPASEYMYWDVTVFNSPALDDGTKSYYVYLKCSKSNQTASYYLSKTPIGLEQVNGYYHLWVGILNSEFEGDRSFVKMFGFTEILPGRVTAEMFSSPDGNTFMDLVNGIFEGTFTFKSGSKGLEQLSEWANKQSQIDSAASTAAAASATAAAAQSAAATAKSNADAANAAIADMASDGKLSPVEKQSYKVIFDGYTSEKAKYDAQADQFAVTRVYYDAAYDALNAYLTPLLASLTTTSDIVSDTFTSKLKGYTDARTDLANAIAAKAKTLADNAQNSANSASSAAAAAQTTANSAASAASSAQTSANGANAAIADMASDDKITASEKQQMKKEWDIIVSEKSKNDTQADTFGVSKAAYGTAYTALATAIGTNLDNLTTTWDLGSGGGAALRTKFKTYYDERTSLLNAIAAKAKTLADNAQAKVDGLQIGVRNLVLNSKGDFTTTGYQQVAHLQLSSRLVAGQQYILSVVDRSIGVYRLTYSIMEIGFVNRQIITPNEPFIAQYDSPAVNIYQELNQTVDVRLSNVMLAKGNKVPDWTPAPEDIQADAQTKADAAQQAAQAYAASQAAYEREVAKAHADGIVTAEEQARINQAAQNLEAAKNDAQTKSDAAKAAAIATAAADAQSKANAAQQAAQAYAASQAAYEREVAKAHADGIVTAEEQARINQAAQNLEAAKNDAQTKSDAAKAAAIAAAAADAQAKVDAIKIGGVNLLDRSSKEKGGAEYLEYANLVSIFDKYGIGQYVISFDLKASIDGSVNCYSTPGSQSDFKYLWEGKGLAATTSYKRYSVVINVVNSNSASVWSPLSFYSGYGSGVNFWVRDVMVERGNTPSAYDISQFDKSIGNLFTNSAIERTSGSRFNEIPTANILSNYVGEVVTISMDVKASETAVLRVYPYQNSGITVDYANSYNIGTIYERINFTGRVVSLSVPSGYTAGGIGMYLPNNPTGIVYVKNIQISLGYNDLAYKENIADTLARIAAADYLKTALSQQTTTEGGLLLTSLIQLGEWLNGTFTAKAGVNGVGSDPLAPTFWGGGTLEDAIRTVSELINGTKSGNPRAPFVVSRDGKIFGLEGYIAGFRMIERLLNMDTLDIGEVNGLPMVRVRDKSNNNRDAVIIADMPISDPASLAGGGSIDVTPTYVTQETSAEDYSFWLTQAGISTTKSALSSEVTANTSYALIFNLNASNNALGSSVDSRVTSSGSSLWATFTINAYDSNNTMLSSITVPFNGSSANYGYTYILDKIVSLNINTIIGGNLFIEVKMSYSASRRFYDPGDRCGYSYTSNMVVAVKSNTKVQLLSGKGVIEIGRGFQALFGVNRFFQIQDKPGVPLVRAEGEFMFNKCMMQDILLEFWATGTKGFNLSINRWQGHSAFTSKDNIGIARTGTGTYTITHNLKTRGIINNSGDYQVTGHGSEFYITVTMQGEDSVKITTNDDASPNDTANLFLQFWSTKNWKTT